MSSRRMYGVSTGLVQEIDEAGARLRVRLPWLGEEIDSAWAPIATPHTGSDRGMYFLPEVGDEVLVAFEHGDFDHPFVLGYLWNGVDQPPESDRNLRVIVTPGGHTLRFEDTDGAKKIRLETAGGRRITLDDTAPGKIHIESGGHEVLLDDTAGAGKIEATTSGGQKLTLGDAPPTAKLEISSGVALKLDPSGVTLDVPVGTVTVNGASASVTASGAMSVTAGGAVSVTAGGALSVTASAINFSAAVANFSGIVRANLVQATTISGTTYTPGVGNLF
jgi:phage baseplate assembly protein V